jgi:hypothetical protein
MALECYAIPLDTNKSEQGWNIVYVTCYVFDTGVLYPENAYSTSKDSA